MSGSHLVKSQEEEEEEEKKGSKRSPPFKGEVQKQILRHWECNKHQLLILKIWLQVIKGPDNFQVCKSFYHALVAKMSRSCSAEFIRALVKKFY